MTNEAELKPCPFCGSEHVAIRPEISWAAVCKACGARVDADTEAEAIAVWNRRTPEAKPEADVVERNSDYNLGFEDGLAVGSLKQEAAPDVVGLLREARMRLGKYWDAVDIMQDGPDDSDVAMAEGRLAEGHKGCRALLARIDAALESGRE